MRFNVSATIPDGTSKEQFRAMLQNLLVDRFKMATHWEKKEIQTRDLVVAKGGYKIKESPLEGETPAPQFEISPKADTEGFPVLPPGRQSVLAERGSHVAMRRADETMDRFAVYLSACQLHTPVSNVTGLAGEIRFLCPCTGLRRGRRRLANDAGPGLFRAVQEQLGSAWNRGKAM